MCVKSHKTFLILAVSSYGNLFYAAVVVAIPILFFPFFISQNQSLVLSTILQGGFSVHVPIRAIKYFLGYKWAPFER